MHFTNMATEAGGTRLNILFGSQTGTAEEVAERIGRESRRRHIPSHVLPLDDYRIENLICERVVVFVLSTTGQGDPPDNMKKFWKFILRKNLPLDSLQNLLVAVVGLGDSSYLKFNIIAKKLHKRLIQLGAASLIEIACADEQHPLGLDAVIDPWVVLLLNKLTELYPIPNGKEIISKDVLALPKFTISTIPCSFHKTDKYNNLIGTKYDKDNPWKTHIVSNIRKTQTSHYQDVRLIKFDLKNSNLSYVPGDVLMVKPCNIKETVDTFFTLVGWDPNTLITVKQRIDDIPLPIDLPTSCTLEYLFIHYLSIQAVPKRYFFELLSFFTTSELEKERLLEFCAAEGQDDLVDYCYRPKRSYIEVLQDFPCARENLKMEYIFDLFPAMKPRAFSIASSMKIDADSADILMAVVNYKTKMYAPRRGVCSTWLASCPACSTPVNVWIAKGTITFPKDDSVPVIMVGPGTGVAPFRSFISDRLANKATGEMILFFGCRNKNGDDFFRDEWNDVSSKLKLSVYTAYSRDQPSKIYVQHKIKEHGELIWNLLSKQSAYFFIAGNSKDMPNDVIDCLKDIFSKYGNMDSDNADKYFKMLEMKHRFQCETWS